MHLNFSDIIAAISLFWTAITFGRTVRHRPEASWMNSYIVTRLRNATPPLTDEHGRLPVRKAMIANDGDGDAFDVRVFGHNCIIRAYAWEKPPNGSWKIGERTMVPRMSNEDGDDVKIAIWLPDGADDMPEDARICIHWTKSPTRLRRCGYEEIPLTSELADKWWEEKDWKASHRLAERFRTWCAHRRFHHNPEDARKSPQPTI